MQASTIQVQSADGLPRQCRDGSGWGFGGEEREGLERLSDMDARGTKTDRALIRVESKLQGRGRAPSRMLNSQVPQIRAQSE